MKNKKAVIALVILLVIVLTVLFVIKENSFNEEKPFFLKCLGDYTAISSNGNIELSLIYIDSNNNPMLSTFLKDKDISFNDKSVNIEKFDITKGDSFGEIALYSLNLMLSLDKDTCLCEELIILDNDGKSERFNIGKIKIHANYQIPESLEILKNTGLSSKLNRYEISFKNNLDDKIRIKCIKRGLFSDIINSIDYIVPNDMIKKTESVDERINLSKDSSIDITINFNDEQYQYDYYIYNPIIVYDINGYEESLEPYYATYGLSYSDEQMKEFENIYKGGIKDE